MPVSTPCPAARRPCLCDDVGAGFKPAPMGTSVVTAPDTSTRFTLINNNALRKYFSLHSAVSTRVVKYYGK